MSKQRLAPASIIDRFSPRQIARARALMAKHLLPPNENGCVLWNGTKHPRGYGQVSISGNRYVRASRLAFELYHGQPIASGMYILHLCDTPACCAVEHLREGTHQENMDDRSNRGRTEFGDAHHDAKLSTERVRALWDLRSLGWSQRELGRIFGVTRECIRQVLSGRSWRHVPRGDSEVTE